MSELLLGPGKAGEEREVRPHDHHDKSGQPSRSLGALGLVFILGLVPRLRCPWAGGRSGTFAATAHRQPKAASFRIVTPFFFSSPRTAVVLSRVYRYPSYPTHWQAKNDLMKEENVMCSHYV